MKSKNRNKDIDRFLVPYFTEKLRTLKKYEKCVVCGELLDESKFSSDFYCSHKCYHTENHIIYYVKQHINTLRNQLRSQYNIDINEWGGEITVKIVGENNEE